MNSDDWDDLYKEAARIYGRNSLYPLSKEDFQQECALYVYERLENYSINKSKLKTVPFYVKQLIYTKKRRTGEILTTNKCNRIFSGALEQILDENVYTKVDSNLQAFNIMDSLSGVLTVPEKNLLDCIIWGDIDVVTSADKKRLQRIKTKLKGLNLNGNVYV